jgi:hypothetical protein
MSKKLQPGLHPACLKKNRVRIEDPNRKNQPVFAGGPGDRSAQGLAGLREA